MKLFTSFLLTTNIEGNLPPVLMICELWIDLQYHERKWSRRYETVHKLCINYKHWSKLTGCIDECELLIHNIIKENEAQEMKLFTSYPLTTNTEVNLPTVLMMCELLFHNIIKEIEVEDMKRFTNYPLTTSTEVNLPPVLIMCELLIHSIIKEMKHEIYMKQFTSYPLTTNTKVYLPPV